MCVFSRTFGNAAPGGGVGVRMLVPLVDMLNHGGDQTESGMLADPDHAATDNVRCGEGRNCEGLDGERTMSGGERLLKEGNRGEDETDGWRLWVSADGGMQEWV